jgi:hypothetical protein
MPKRFIDSDLWKKQWFCDLSPALKSFWIYIFSNCDNSGVWEINIPLAQFQIGAKIAEEEVLSDFAGNIIKISDSKMLIKDFISFQYGELKEDSVPHRNVFRLLEKHNLSYPINTLSIGYQAIADTLKDKDKDKDKNKDKKKEEEKDIEEIYLKYPSVDKNNDNRPTGKSSKDKDKIKTLLKIHTKVELISTIENYIESSYQAKSYIKNLSVFLNNLPDKIEIIKPVGKFDHITDPIRRAILEKNDAREY